jgi:hypothetical protein
VRGARRGAQGTESAVRRRAGSAVWSRCHFSVPVQQCYSVAVGTPGPSHRIKTRRPGPSRHDKACGAMHRRDLSIWRVLEPVPLWMPSKDQEIFGSLGQGLAWNPRPSRALGSQARPSHWVLPKGLTGLGVQVTPRNEPRVHPPASAWRRSPRPPPPRAARGQW